MGLTRPIALLAAVLFAIGSLQAAPAIFPLKDVRAGQRGIGRTVFAGTRVEDFQVEILGVLENIGPLESIILARLTGGPLDKTGVMQGMSGSPVYIDGRLVGAVALSFPLSKDAIAGIRPIEDMLRVAPDAAPSRNLAAVKPHQPFAAGGADRDARLEEIATPVSFSGFTAATLDHFSSQLKQLGMDPRQGVSGGGRPSDRLGNPNLLEPGSMISVQLLSGDMSVGADGTVTSIDGNRLYAFGHRFLDGGTSNLPFARAEVLTLLPNLSSSFKISTAREWMGTITEDRNTAVSGFLGRQASLIPIDIRVSSATHQSAYHMRMIEDRVMTPLVAQMAVFSSIDATERNVGSTAFTVKGKIDFDGGSVRLDNVYSGDVSVSAFAALGVSTPLTYALSSGFDALKLKGISLDIAAVDRRSQWQIADVATPRVVHPGENVDIFVAFSTENGTETAKKVQYRVPLGAPAGPLYFTVSDATSTNALEFQSALGNPLRSPAQLLDLLNSLRTNTKAYVRVWRAESTYSIDGRDLPDPPASLAMILARTQTAAAGLATIRGSKIAEIEIPAGANVVTGSKTSQVEVRE